MFTLGKLVALILFCWFVWGTNFYIQEYLERTIGTVVRTEIDDTRQFPSLSICLVKRNTTLAPIVADLDGILEQTRLDVLSSFEHSVLGQKHIDKDSTAISMHYGHRWRYGDREQECDSINHTPYIGIIIPDKITYLDTNP